MADTADPLKVTAEGLKGDLPAAVVINSLSCRMSPITTSSSSPPLIRCWAGVRKGDEALQLRLNAAIRAIRASGKYDAIAKKYFDLDPYGAS